MSRLPEDVCEFLAALDPIQKSAAEALVEIVMRSEPEFQVAMKWKRPTFTVNGNWHHWICAIQPAKGRVSLEFHKGVLLDDPGSVLVGKGRYLRRLTVADGQRVDSGPLVPLILDAVEKQTVMLE
jgi:hypothetical protein